MENHRRPIYIDTPHSSIWLCSPLVRGFELFSFPRQYASQPPLAVCSGFHSLSNDGGLFSATFSSSRRYANTYPPICHPASRWHSDCKRQCRQPIPHHGRLFRKRFALLSTNAGRSEGPSVFPHAHKMRYENFFCEKGALNLWLATSNNSQEARTLEPGDFGASPPGKIHAFQTLRPDTQMFGVVFPGGLE
jgi:hypothetical protein